MFRAHRDIGLDVGAVRATHLRINAALLVAECCDDRGLDQRGDTLDRIDGHHRMNVLTAEREAACPILVGSF